MDGITTLQAVMMYSLLVSPLLSIVLLFFWLSVDAKNTAKVQLLGIVVLFVLGFLAINSTIIIIVHAAAIILLVAWLFAYRRFFSKDRLSSVATLQISYAIAFVALFMLTNVGFILVCIISVFSMIRLYPWAFGDKRESNGRALVLSIFAVQIMFTVLTITFYLMATF